MAAHPNPFDTLKDAFKSYALVISAVLGLLSTLSPVLNFILWPAGYEAAGKALSTGLGLISLLTIFILLSPKGPNAWPFVGLAVSLGLAFLLVWTYLDRVSMPGISPLPLLLVGVLGNTSLTACFGFIMAAIVQRARQDPNGAPNIPQSVLAKKKGRQQKHNRFLDLFFLVYYTQWEKIIESKTKGGYWSLYRHLAQDIVSIDLKQKEKALEWATFHLRLLVLLTALLPPALNKNWEGYRLLNGLASYLIELEKSGLALRKAMQKPGLSYLDLFKLTLNLIDKCIFTTYHYGADYLYQEIKSLVGNLTTYRSCMSPFEAGQLIMNAQMADVLLFNPYRAYGRKGAASEPIKDLENVWREAKSQIEKGQLAEASNTFYAFGNEMIALADKLPEGLHAKSEAVLIMATAFTVSAAFASHIIDEGPERFSQAMKKLIYVLVKYVDQKYAARRLASLNNLQPATASPVLGDNM